MLKWRLVCTSNFNAFNLALPCYYTINYITNFKWVMADLMNMVKNSSIISNFKENNWQKMINQLYFIHKPAIQSQYCSYQTLDGAIYFMWSISHYPLICIVSQIFTREIKAWKDQIIHIPLSLPDKEFYGRIKEPANLSQVPCSVNGHKKVWSWCILECNIHSPTSEIIRDNTF